MDYWNKYAVVTLSYLQAYLKCEDLQGNKAAFFFFPSSFHGEVICVVKRTSCFHVLSTKS